MSDKTPLAFLDGVEGASVVLPKASDKTIQITVLDDRGIPYVLTGGTLDLVIHDTYDRANAATATIACALNTAANGDASVTLTTANTNFGPGTYYGWVRFTDAGTLKFFARKPSVIQIF